MVANMEAWQVETLRVFKYIISKKGYQELKDKVARVMSYSEISQEDKNMIIERMDYIDRIRAKTLQNLHTKEDVKDFFENKSMEANSIKTIRAFMNFKENQKKVNDMSNDEIIKEIMNEK